MNHRNFQVRLSLFYGAMFLAIGFYMPYFPVWLENRGMGKAEIAVLIAAPMFVRIIFTPLLSFMTDHFGNRRLALILMLWGALLSSLFLPLSDNFYVLLLVTTLFGIFWTTVMPVTEAMAMLQVRRTGMHYGHVRLWGSLAFIVASMAGGLLIDTFGGSVIWPALMFSLALTLVLGYALPKTAKTSQDQSLEKAAPLPPIRPRDFWVLIKNPVFLLFLFAGGLGQASHAFYYGFGTLNWYALGYSEQLIGTLWAVGVIAEIILFIYYRTWFDSIRADYLLLFGSLVAILRWAVTAMDPPLWLLFGLQTLHAFSFAMLHIGAVHFISRAVPEKLSATAQGIYGAFAMGSLLGIMTIASGPLYDSYAGTGYMAMAVCALAAALVSRLLISRWDGQEIILEETG